MDYPVMIPVKPDVDMVVLPADTVVSEVAVTTDTITADTVSFLEPVVVGGTGTALSMAPSLQITFECSFAPAGPSLDYALGVSVDGTVDGITKKSRPFVVPALPNWLSMSQTLVLFKDVDYELDGDTGEVVLNLCLCGGTTTGAPVIDGSSLGWSVAVSPVLTE